MTNCFKALIICLFLLIGMCVYAEEDYAIAGYPVVDQLETRVLGAVYPQQDIYIRLDRLETKVFGTTSDAPLSDRVERLNDAVLGNNTLYEQDDDLSDMQFSGNNMANYANVLSILLMILQMFL